MSDKLVSDIKFLHQISKLTSVEEINQINLFSRLEDTLNDIKGLGLHSIQIGIPLNAFLCKFHKLNSVDGKTYIPIIFKFFNPKIISQYDRVWSNSEGCLSLPGIRKNIPRYKFIHLQYFDENGKEQDTIFQDMEAIIVQHELDHSIGKLIIDYNTIGRNEPCPICVEKGINIKYKKCYEHYI